MNIEEEKKEDDTLICPICGGNLLLLMPTGKVLHCGKCNKYFKNENDHAGVEVNNPNTRKDVFY